MGLIQRFLSPWKVLPAIQQYENVHVELIREMLEVAKMQTRVNESMVNSLAAMSKLYEITDSAANEPPRENPPDIAYEFAFPAEEEN